MEAALVSGTLPQDSHSIALDMDYAEDMIGVDVGSVIKLTIGDQENSCHCFRSAHKRWA